MACADDWNIEDIEAELGLVFHPKWSEQERELLENDYKYHNEYASYIYSRARFGPEYDGKSPTKPKHKMSDQKLNITKRGALLHEKLKSMIVYGNAENIMKLDDVHNIVTLQDMSEHLLLVYKAWKKSNSTGLEASIEYGKWLNHAFELHKIAKLSKTVSETWDAWLKNNVGISRRHSYRLRELATLLQNYPLFTHIGMAWTEIHNLRKEIKEMLSDADIASFWKQKGGESVTDVLDRLEIKND